MSRRASHASLAPLTPALSREAGERCRALRGSRASLDTLTPALSRERERVAYPLGPSLSGVHGAERRRLELRHGRPRQASVEGKATLSRIAGEGRGEGMRAAGGESPCHPLG
jgi:hypothetical protein